MYVSISVHITDKFVREMLDDHLIIAGTFFGDLAYAALHFNSLESIGSTLGGEEVAILHDFCSFALQRAALFYQPAGPRVGSVSTRSDDMSLPRAVKVTCNWWIDGELEDYLRAKLQLEGILPAPELM